MSRPPRSDLDKAQDEWYARLKAEGFEDIEDHSYEDKPLKRWSGFPIHGSLRGSSYGHDDLGTGNASSYGLLDTFANQEELLSAQSSFPEKRFVKEERLLNHADFDDICASVCGHGNHKLSAPEVRSIWERYLEGETNRGIAKVIGTSHVTVFRCIANLTKWAESMGEETEISTVVVREYDSDHDAAMLFSTWRNSLWFDTPGRDESKNHKFFRDCTKLIKMVLASQDTKVRIACLSNDPGLILGASVINIYNLVWVYVKADYRARGIATMLSKGAVTISNPSTKIGKSIAKNKGLKIHGKD